MDLKKYSIERMMMVKKAVDMTNTLTPVNDVFDMACNNGYWLNTIRRFLPEATLTGMDMQDFSDRGWVEYKASDIEFRSGNSLEFLEGKDEQYDLLLCMGILYYYDDINSFLETVTKATRSALVVDTFCYNSTRSTEKRVSNPPNRMTEAAAESSSYVTIPSEKKLMACLDALGFYSYKIDEFSDKYSDSVGKRLELDIKRSCVLAIRKKDYSDMHKYERT